MENSNLESQFEEIRVLQEILQDCLEAEIPISAAIPLSESSTSEPMSGEIKVKVRIPEPGFYCSCQKPQNIQATSTGTGIQLPQDDQEALILSRLPPIVLHFKFGYNYPSNSIPEFRLTCVWLGEKELSKLSTNLKKLWYQNCGSPILFNWYLFLVDSLDWFEIGTESRPYNLDKSTFLESTCLFGDQLLAENIGVHLVNYERLQVLTDFKVAYHVCPICCLSKAGSSSVKFNCGHVFCKACVEEYFTMHIQQGSLEAVKCLEYDCDHVLDSVQVAKLVPPAIFERYDQLLLSRALDKMPDVLHCPRSLCAKPVIFETIDKFAECSSCSYAFCTECKRAFHGVMPCKNNQETQAEIELVEEYQKATSEKKQDLERNHGKKRMRDLVAEVLSENWIKHRSKLCPDCQAPIERNDGCNHMTCTQCNLDFCWGCLKPLEGHRDDPTKACGSIYGAELQLVEVTHTFDSWDLSAEIGASDGEEEELRKELEDLQEYERRRVIRLRELKVETAQ